MRLILLVVALALPAGLLAGCGSEDLGSVSAADAAAATREAETARMRMTLELEGAGVPQPIKVTAEGVTATERVEMDVTFDFGPFLEAFGQSGDGKTRILVGGGDVLVDPPQLPGLSLPGGATWVTADLAEIAKAVGIDPGGMGELMRISTEQQLNALDAAGSVKKVGDEEIDGESTVHLKGTVKFSDYLAALPAERRARVEKLIDQLEALPGGDQIEKDLNRPTPIELWVDGNDRIRRLRQDASLPAQQGLPGGSFKMTIDYSDFGTALDIDKPDGDEVWDATDRITKSLPATKRTP
jgi:hypothetical protein